MILEFLLFAFVCYIVYKVVFEFIVPVARTTQKIRRQFNDIRNGMPDPYSNNGPAPEPFNQSRPTQPSRKPDNNTGSKAGDYIDFEEVKP